MTARKPDPYKRDVDQEYMDRLAGSATDLEWWQATLKMDRVGLCGGCGWETCHPGEPCGDVYSHTHGKRVCDKCQTRKDQGSWPNW